MNLLIVTGTSRGLGQAIEAEFAGNGWEICPLSRPAYDLRQPDWISGLVSRLPDAERIVFINNAFDMQIKESVLLSQAQIQDSVQINITTPLALIVAILQRFPHAEIINISSGAAARAIPNWSLYCTGKAALSAFMRNLQAEGVKCLNYEPGVIDTAMQSQIRAADFPGVENFIALKDKLKSAHQVAADLFSIVSEEKY